MKKKYFLIPLITILFGASCASNTPTEEESSLEESTIETLETSTPEEPFGVVSSPAYTPDEKKINAIFDNRAYKYTKGCYYYDESNITFKFDYSDDYFKASSFDINTDLAEFLSVPAATAYAEEDIKNLLTMLGYTDVIQYWYGENPLDEYYWNPTAEDYSRAEFSIAKKKAKINNENVTIYATVIRGTRGLEWYGNLDLGNPFTEGNTTISNYYQPDYYKCANDYILPYLKDYITNDEDYNKDTSITWITGQSRGAAVANVLGALFTNENLISAENTFVYTYGCPNTYIFDSANKAECSATYPNRPTNYKNIYNYNNPGDYVAYLPLSAWGFNRFGTDIFMTFTGNSLADLKYIFKAMLGEKYTAYTSSDEFVNLFSEFAPSFYDAVVVKKDFMDAITELVPYIAGEGEFDLSILAGVIGRLSDDPKGVDLILNLAEYALDGGIAAAHIPEGYYILVNMMYENINE